MLRLRKKGETGATCRVELVTAVGISDEDDEEAIEEKARRQIADQLAKAHFWFDIETVKVLATY